MNDIIFPTGSVPVAVAARVYGKDPTWVRAGIIAGWLPIGVATVAKTKASGNTKQRTNFYISPLKLYQDTGYIWKGEKK